MDKSFGGNTGENDVRRMAEIRQRLELSRGDVVYDHDNSGKVGSDKVHVERVDP